VAGRPAQWCGVDGDPSAAHWISRHGTGGEKERELGWFGWSIVRDIGRDGRKIVFEEQGDGGGSNYTVFLRDTDGSPPTRIGEGLAIAISPDAKWVITKPPKGGPLSLVPTGAGEARQLTHDTISYGSASWLADGKRLLASGIEAGHGARDYLIDLSDGTSKPITPEGVVGVHLSPDGKSTAVLASFAEERRIPPSSIGQIPHLPSGPIETCRRRSGTPAPTAAGFAGTVPTCPHRPLESHFVEMHSGAARKTHPASLSCVPDQTTAVLPSAGWSRPSETSACSPGRSHRLPSAARPVGVAPAPSAPDTADRSPAPCSLPSQTAAPLVVPLRSHRLALPPPQSAC